MTYYGSAKDIETMAASFMPMRLGSSPGEKHVQMFFSCHLGCLQNHCLCNQKVDYYQI
jgi:hypothetical protein